MIFRVECELVNNRFYNYELIDEESSDILKVHGDRGHNCIRLCICALFTPYRLSALTTIKCCSIVIININIIL